MLIFFLLPFCIVSWSSDTHFIISKMAFSRLPRSTRSSIRRIYDTYWSALEYDFIYSSAIPDSIPESAPDHYLNTPHRDCSAAYDPDTHCPDGRCVVEAIKRHYRHVADPATSRAQRKESVIFLLHLVADLHQPLHLGFKEDLGGNKIEVYHPDGSGRLSLHEWWDHGLLDEIRLAG